MGPNIEVIGMHIRGSIRSAAPTGASVGTDYEFRESVLTPMDATSFLTN